jgi:hypothetical protein
VWTVDELRSVLGDDADFVIQAFNVEEDGNFREEATGERTGANILYQRGNLTQRAAQLGMPEEAFRETWERCRHKLFVAREKRVHPYKDDKILTDWNGLMIAALAKAARVLERAEYGERAQQAAEFILRAVRDDKGRLLHRFREGEAGIRATVDDYAFFIWGLLELYETTFDVSCLRSALELNRLFVDGFWDEQGGGFYITSDESDDLPARKKEIYDGALPSGNSVAALNLLRLGRITADPLLERKAEAIKRAFAGNVGQMPFAYTQLLIAVQFGLGPSYEVVIAGDPGSDDTKGMLRSLRSRFLPNKVVVLRPQGDDAGAIIELAGYTEHQTSQSGQATAYVCRNFNCELPTTDTSTMLGLLDVNRE